VTLATHDTLEALDLAIRAGHGAEAIARLSGLTSGKPPRAHAAELARAAWRVGLADVGLRLLSPLVRPAQRRPVTATAVERAEYSACLVKAGAIADGERILAGLDAEALPRVHLYRAFARVARWDYAGSIPFLQQYLGAKGLPSYDRLVGRVNLAAAYVLERRHLAAEHLLRELLHTSSVQRLQLALGRVLELSAENFLFQRRWDRAKAFVDRAHRTLEGTEGIDLFITEKTAAVTDFLSKPGPRALESLRSVRKRAEERHHWESVRDCDRALAIGTRDEALLSRVYFGTPYDSFRRWLLLDCPRYQPPRVYDWRCGRKGGPVLDMALGKVDARRAGLQPGELLHRLISTLASDFYRPFSTAALHSALYPDEIYNPESSPVRVRQAMKRLRQWLQSKRFPLQIDEEEGRYRLAGDGPCTVRLTPQTQPADRRTLLLLRLRDTWPDSVFSAAEAGRLLGASARTALRLIDAAVAEGRIERVREWRSTRYRFAA